ncbi:Uncharacterised protein [Vibrio cholerae]|uniref:Uncharacterized protein n=1 Tax=Vibrio cholerae TaxID=666 RepID=A0A655QA40_VIBCL|nr:Uncharacterised protein [Vibrio cholerae]CSB00892.1 Uncharacterised protein [Vibrio cholerae]CSB43800.1 Uncharacterised protein [Vibrio cholerae]CSB93249.1 Uncharacterised protein [Vibrio cholerae]CSI54238.1 Uncharacterised protein [Vibrio cholerae]
MLFVVTHQRREFRSCADQGYTTTRNNAFFYRCASRVQRVFYAIFLLFHFHFGCCAHFDYCNAASQFCYALLQFLFVVVRSGFFDLLTDLRNTTLDRGLIASTIDDG